MRRAFTIILPVFCFFLSGTTGTKPGMASLDQMIAKETNDLIAFYKDLHQNPEISLEEVVTSGKMAATLRASGFEVTENVGGNGVVGIMKNGQGPTILLRTDMDALPMPEKTGLDYASQVPDKMHSCGHDMHMTVWSGTAKMLSQLKNEWKGTLMMIGQPAEEVGAGAEMMIEDGLFKKFPVPDYGLALHVNPYLEAGTVGYCEGYFLASVNSVDIQVKGIGAHGAAPHDSVDPIVLGSMIVMELQTIVSRNVNPLDAAVVTVGAFNGGTAHNIIPDEVNLKLTLRTYKPEVREQLISGIERICKGAAISMGLPEELHPVVKVSDRFTPATFNDPTLTGNLIKSFQTALGTENVIETSPVMAGEDFSRYAKTEEKIPTCMYWLGAVPPEKMAESKANGSSLPGLHSPYFYPEPELAIKTGVKAMTSAVIDLMNE